MKLSWTSHLKTKEEKEEFEKEVRAARKVLKRLSTLLEEYYNISDKEMHKRENFFMPAWAEKQAYELGYQKAHKQTINLIEV
jgi:hypothetical protein